MTRAQVLARAKTTRRWLLEVADAADEISKAARRAAEEAPWAINTAADLRMATDSVKVRTQGSDPTGAQALSGRPGSGDEHDTTPDGPNRGDRLRVQIRRALRKFNQAASRLEEGADLLEDAMDRIDPHRRVGLEGTRQTPFPKLVTQDELDAYEAAKRRRAARGQDWGAG